MFHFTAIMKNSSTHVKIKITSTTVLRAHKNSMLKTYKIRKSVFYPIVLSLARGKEPKDKVIETYR